MRSGAAGCRAERRALAATCSAWLATAALRRPWMAAMMEAHHQLRLQARDARAHGVK